MPLLGGGALGGAALGGAALGAVDELAAWEEGVAAFLAALGASVFGSVVLSGVALAAALDLGATAAAGAGTGTGVGADAGTGAGAETCAVSGESAASGDGASGEVACGAAFFGGAASLFAGVASDAAALAFATGAALALPLGSGTPLAVFCFFAGGAFVASVLEAAEGAADLLSAKSDPLSDPEALPSDPSSDSSDSPTLASEPDSSSSSDAASTFRLAFFAAARCDGMLLAACARPGPCLLLAGSLAVAAREIKSAEKLGVIWGVNYHPAAAVHTTPYAAVFLDVCSLHGVCLVAAPDRIAGERGSHRRSIGQRRSPLEVGGRLVELR